MMKYRVASVEEIPEGGSLLVEVQSRSIAVFRFKGELFAVDDTCPHKGASLHEATVEDGILSCPWHQWQFELRTGRCPINPLSRIDVYPIYEEGDAIFLETEDM